MPKKILIADDSLINREMLKIIFDDRFEILEAMDGQEVIEQLENCGDAISLLLLDLKMPHKDGFDVLEYMREHDLLKVVPAIVITASTNIDDEIHAYNCGAAEIIHKPFVPDIVLRRSQNLMELYASRKKLSAELAERTQQLHDVQEFDSLTGLMMRSSFLEAADKFLQELSGEEIRQYSFAYGNIRNFKYYSVKYGMEASDDILKMLAKKIMEEPYNVLCGRFSQDHFVVLAKNAELQDATFAIDAEFDKVYGKYGMQLQTGVYVLREAGEKAFHAVEMAKLACDAIHDANSNYCIYDTELEHNFGLKQYVLQNLDEAIAKNWIKVYYQPVVRTMTGAICGLEALVRWIDPVHGFLSPADFIPALEEAGVIHVLDRHVIREVCKTQRFYEDSCGITVPISVNLSRTDFLKCDMVQNIEELTQEFNVPRDMINIEITESVMITDEQLMTENVDRFHKLGYNVWMDDFGSGYSSLNVLKNFRFDEIKLDMGFMRDFNETSRNIIMCIISMAKKMGVSTLAEGVETQEQRDFLKKIGCDKVQGFFYSRPYPIEILIKLCQEQNMPVEMRKEQPYYSNLQKIDLMTERPVMIAEYDGEKCTFLYENERFLEEWNSLKIGSFKEKHPTLFNSNSFFWKKYRTLLDNIFQGVDTQEMDYALNGLSMRICTSCFSRSADKILCQVELYNITKLDEDESSRISRIMVDTMIGMQDGVFAVDIAEKTFQLLERSTSGSNELDKELVKLPAEEAIRFAADNYIHPDDREEFVQFTDITTVKERMSATKSGFLTNYFRTKVSNGGYIWKVHYLANAHGTDLYFYFDKPVGPKQLKLLDKFYNEMNSGDEYNIQKVLFNSINDAPAINLYWKDREHRFIGANKGFLNTFGFESVDVIYGKTSEELNWHLNNAPYREEEENIFRTGVGVKNKLSKCIIHGATYDTIYMKAPLYKNGDIVGLWGMFTTLQNINAQNGQVNSVSLLDPHTGVLSVRGALPVVFDYIEGYRMRHEDFAVITISFPHYQSDLEAFGEIFMNSVMARVGSVLRHNVGVRANCASLYGGIFAIYMRTEDRNAVHALVEKIREEIRAIHEVNEFPVTLRPETTVFYASESGDLQELLWRSMLLAVFKNMDEYTDLIEKEVVQQETKQTLSERYSSYFEQKFNPDELGDVLSVANLQNSVLTSFSNVYIGMHIINLDEDKFMKIWCMDYVDEIMSPHKSAQEAMDAIIENLLSPESHAEAQAFLDLSTLSERLQGQKMLQIDYNGVVSGWCRGKFTPVSFHKDGSVKEVLYLVEHIHEDRLREESLRRQSEVDGLTQLYNHTTGEKYITNYLENKAAGMFCLFDIDNFKHFNDTYGHAIGDEIVRMVGSQMKHVFRDGDVLVRVGGDEFAVFAPGIPNRQVGEMRMKNLKERIVAQQFEGVPERVHISVGMLICGEDEYKSFEEIYKLADSLMYIQKRKKKNYNHLTNLMEITDEMPVAMLIYRADAEEKIVFASRKMVELFECHDLDEFMKFTNGTFLNIVHPKDNERVHAEIDEQIASHNNVNNFDYVEYDIITARGNVKAVDDYGHLVDSQQYGSAYFVVLTEHDIFTNEHARKGEDR